MVSTVLEYHDVQHVAEHLLEHVGLLTIDLYDRGFGGYVVSRAASRALLFRQLFVQVRHGVVQRRATTCAYDRVLFGEEKASERNSPNPTGCLAYLPTADMPSDIVDRM